MRLVGFLKLNVARSGGGARFGVSGAGVGFAAGACRLRGCNFGKRSRRSGTAADCCSVPFGVVSKIDGIFAW